MLDYKLFFRFTKYILPYRPKQIAILALSCVSILLELINPYLGKLIVDRAIVNKNFEIFVAYGLIGAVIFISNGIIKAVAALLEKGTDNKIYSQFLRFILAQKTKAKESAKKSVNICAASAKSAMEPDHRPPATSASINVKVRHRQTSRAFLPRCLRSVCSS